MIANRLEQVVPNIKSMHMPAGDKANHGRLWTEASRHAGIASNAIDDEYVRHAIFETFEIEVPLSRLSPHRYSSPCPFTG